MVTVHVQLQVVPQKDTSFIESSSQVMRCGSSSVMVLTLYEGIRMF